VSTVRESRAGMDDEDGGKVRGMPTVSAVSSTRNGRANRNSREGLRLKVVQRDHIPSYYVHTYRWSHASKLLEASCSLP
jgi:ATP-dependent helicase YprA (DUF1998 family)